jgi:hypothetical protein
MCWVVHMTILGRHDHTCKRCRQHCSCSQWLVHSRYSLGQRAMLTHMHCICVHVLLITRTASHVKPGNVHIRRSLTPVYGMRSLIHRLQRSTRDLDVDTRGRPGCVPGMHAYPPGYEGSPGRSLRPRSFTSPPSLHYVPVIYNFPALVCSTKTLSQDKGK